MPDEEWSNLKVNGVEVVWLMGIWQIGPCGVCRSTDIENRVQYGKILPSYTSDDIIGSPYAVVDYVWYAVGTDSDAFPV